MLDTYSLSNDSIDHSFELRTSYPPRNDPKLAGHPIWRETAGERTKWFVPLRLHGDGAEMMANDSVLVTSFTGLLAKGTTRRLSCLMAAWPYSITAKAAHHAGNDTWKSIWKMLKWSLNALATGKHPMKDTQASHCRYALSH